MISNIWRTQLKPMFYSCTLLYRSHLGLWLSLLLMITMMILLANNLLQIKAKQLYQEQMELGLVANAHLTLKDKNHSIPLTLAHQIARNINEDYDALIVPLYKQDALSCRFYTQESFIKESQQQIDGYTQWVEQRHYQWVPSGQFAITLHQLDLSVSDVKLTLFIKKSLSEEQIIDDVRLTEFDENAIAVDLSSTGNFKAAGQSQQPYFFAHKQLPNNPLGPYFYDETSGYFILQNELDDIAYNAISQIIYHQHLPFLQGANIEQLQLSAFEYNHQEQQIHNMALLIGLLFQQNNSAQPLNRIFISEPLFNKIFSSDFDFKTIKFNCPNLANTAAITTTKTSSTGQTNNHQAIAYGHFYQKPSNSNNPNQVFMPFDAKSQATSQVNGFLIKDLGQLGPAIKALKAALEPIYAKPQKLEQQLQWQLAYTDKQLSSYLSLNILAFSAFIAMGAILFVLTKPLQKVMVEQLFLIKLYGGRYLLGPVLCSLILIPIAVILALALNYLSMHYFNTQVLSAYKVPLIKASIEYFIQASAIVMTLWMVIWVWVISTLKRIIEQDT